MKEKPFQKLFIKMFITYIIAVLVPLSVASYIYTQNSLKRLEESTKKNYLDDIDYFYDVYKASFNEAYTYALQTNFIPNVNNIIKFPKQRGLYEYYNVVKKLSQLAVSSKSIRSIYLYVPNARKVLTSIEGVVDYEEFYDKALIEEFYDADKDRAWFETRSTGDVFSRGAASDGSVDILSYGMKIPVYENVVGGAIFVNLETTKLIQNMFKAKNIDDIYIMNDKGRVLLSKDENLIGQYIFGEEGSFEMPGDSQGIFVSNREYYVVYKKDKTTGWFLVKYVPIGQLKERLKEQTGFFVRIFIIVFCIGVGISIWLSTTSYRPWRKLSNKLAAGKGRPPKKGADAYEIIESTVEEIVRDNELVRKEINNAKPILEDRIIFDMLFNNFTDSDSLEEKMRYVNIQFTKPNFMPVIVSFNYIQNILNFTTRSHIKTVCRKIILNEFANRFYIRGGIVVDEEKLAFIINLENKKLTPALKEELLSICAYANNKLLDSFGNTAVFSFGAVVNRIDSIYESYINARRNQMFRLAISNNSVFFGRENELENVKYPLALFKKISNGIKTRDFLIVKDSIDILFEEIILEQNMPMKEVQQVILMFIGGISNQFIEEGAELDIGKVNIIDWLYECKSPEQLKEKMLEYFNSLMNEKAEQERSIMENDYISKTILYMKNHYGRDIGINDIAQYINLNPTYLSRIFKKATGKTIIEFLTLLRIEKSKVLLEHANKSIKEISAELGYYDVRSFTRFFKKYEGVTPGEYRKSLVRTKKEEERTEG